MKIYSIKLFIKSIIVLSGIIMLFSCKNDIKQVEAISQRDSLLPVMHGYGLTLIYSDSARIKYKIVTPEYRKGGEDNSAYEEFPQGVHIYSYDDDGKLIATIQAKYAKKLDVTQIWEARHEVIIVNSDGKKLETELLFWDMANERIYSDRYTRLTADGQIVEGNNGFESDQNLNDVTFKSVTGTVEVEQP